MRIALCLVFFISCNTARNGLSKELTVWNFKDQALCDCLLSGLDSTGKDPQIQQLKSYDPVAAVLFDSAIYANLSVVMKKIHLDSINRIGKVTEAAQGRKVFQTCMQYYRSEELKTLARHMIKYWRRQKNLKEYISSKYPTW